MNRSERTHSDLGPQAGITKPLGGNKLSNTCRQLGERPRRASLDLAPPFSELTAILDPCFFSSWTSSFLTCIGSFLQVVHRLFSVLKTEHFSMPEVFWKHGTTFLEDGGGVGSKSVSCRFLK